MLEAFKNIELEKILEKISSIGYKSVEFFVSKGNLHIDLDHLNENVVNNLKNILKKFNLKALTICNSHEAQLILSPHDESTDHLIKGSAEDKIKYGVTRTKRTIDLANKLDVSIITVFTGVPNWSKWYPFPDLDVDIWNSYFELFAKRWLPILDYANEHGIKLAFEGEPVNLNYNLETSLQLLETVNYHPSLGICYDPSHIFLARYRPN
jgi:sugar phosphate isomerase/epimerase